MNKSTPVKFNQTQEDSFVNTEGGKSHIALLFLFLFFLLQYKRLEYNVMLLTNISKSQNIKTNLTREQKIKRNQLTKIESGTDQQFQWPVSFHFFHFFSPPKFRFTPLCLNAISIWTVSKGSTTKVFLSVKMCF